VHNWDYGYKSGISSYNQSERLHKFNAWIENDAVWVDADEIAARERDNLGNYLGKRGSEKRKGKRGSERVFRGDSSKNPL
jgi:hypothetical protein